MNILTKIKLKRITAFLLTVALLFGSVPMHLTAADAEDNYDYQVEEYVYLEEGEIYNEEVLYDEADVEDELVYETNYEDELLDEINYEDELIYEANDNGDNDEIIEDDLYGTAYDGYVGVVPARDGSFEIQMTRRHIDPGNGAELWRQYILPDIEISVGDTVSLPRGSAVGEFYDSVFVGWFRHYNWNTFPAGQPDIWSYAVGNEWMASAGLNPYLDSAARFTLVVEPFEAEFAWEDDDIYVRLEATYVRITLDGGNPVDGLLGTIDFNAVEVNGAHTLRTPNRVRAQAHTYPEGQLEIWAEIVGVEGNWLNFANVAGSEFINSTRVMFTGENSWLLYDNIGLPLVLSNTFPFVDGETYKATIYLRRFDDATTYRNLYRFVIEFEYEASQLTAVFVDNTFGNTSVNEYFDSGYAPTAAGVTWVQPGWIITGWTPAIVASTTHVTHVAVWGP
ncbi:MAG: hypothetical protein FWC95_01220, partial [Defluviitaleaceae bacterium]|nr:hypothetical protein [Defluviitaleaceae bacterium]